MNLRYLRYFVGVAEDLSFSRAAVRLNISQSALSRQVQLLEQDLGVRLFDRIGRRIALTPAGRDLLDRCYIILRNVESFCSRAEELAGGSTGFLRVGATPQTLESLISRFLPRYREKYPDVEVSLVEDGAASLLQQVETGTVQVAIAARAPGSHLHGSVLFPLGVLAVVPSGHPLMARTAIDITEIAEEPLLLLRKEFMSRQLFDGACQVAQMRPRIIIESASPHCLLSLAAVDLGVAIVPSTVLLNGMEPHAIPLQQDGKQLGFWMSAVWDPRRYRPPPAIAFVEELHAATRDGYPGQAFRFSEFVPTATADTGPPGQG